MQKYVTGFILFMLIGPALAGNNNSDNWKLVSSKDAFWIKTINAESHELLVAYHEDTPQFLLILKTDSPAPNKTLPVSIQIDFGPKQTGQLRFLEKRPEQSILRLEVNDADKINYLSQMIAGLTMTIYFDFASRQNANANSTLSKKASFSLKGFTVALNDLLIANEIGSLNTAWLMQHNKDRELFCLLTTDVSIKAMQYRLAGEDYNNVLHLIPETGYSIIDHNLGEIIEQVYKIPQRELPYVPRAEKYLMFSNCMEQPFH